MVSERILWHRALLFSSLLVLAGAFVGSLFGVVTYNRHESDHSALWLTTLAWILVAGATAVGTSQQRDFQSFDRVLTVVAGLGSVFGGLLVAMFWLFHLEPGGGWRW